MNMKELGVGDWVMYRNREWQVCSLYQFTGEVGLWRKDSQICENVADLTPIPLTPEILEKNGWKVFDETADYQMYGSPECGIFHTKGTMRYRLETPQASVVCWNVHQLQRAMKLAGIKKEVIL